MTEPLSIDFRSIDYEAVLAASYRSFLQPGDTVFDIGAHDGPHAVQFLDAVGATGRVVCFEPLPDVMETLRRRIAGAANVSLHQLALGAAPVASTSFVRAQGSLAESGLRQRVYNDPGAVTPQSIAVEVSTIDLVAAGERIGALAYIKMDIEGGELDALAGGADTIRRFRPMISVEWGHRAYGAYGHREDSLFDFAAGQGYRIHDPFLRDIGDRPSWDRCKARYCWDYFLVPNERVGEVVARA